MNDEYSTEYATIDLGDFFNIDKITVIPLGCWPVDFDISVSEDGEHFTPLGIPRYSRPADKNGRPYNSGTGGMQAIIEVEKDVFLVTFYSCDPELESREKCYVDSCLIRIKR